jgi:hypothetical protein
MLGKSRDRRKYEKAQLMGANKTLQGVVAQQAALNNALNNELVCVMYTRFWEFTAQAAMLAVIKKRNVQLYDEMEVAIQTHAERLADAPLAITDSEIVVVGGGLI